LSIYKGKRIAMSTPRFRLYIAASLDGFIATPDGGVSWLEPFQGDDFGYDAFIETIGTVVLGRTTYEQVRGFGDWPYAGKRGIVVSSQPPGDLPDGVEQRCPPFDDLVSDLKTRSAGDVWIVGGARTIGAFFDLDAVDGIELFVMPVLLGSGLPLFGSSRSAMLLRLKETRPYPGGVVKLVYDTL
jgi:dihydrofolate reductase